MEADIIEELTPDMNFKYCSALLAVPKGVDDFRLVVDLRDPNRCIIREPHKMPTMDSILTQLKGIDMTLAFFHVKLDRRSRHITNFYSGDSFFRYKRLPFGLCNAPDIFQKTMEAILKGCPGTLIYLDDILVFGKSKGEHDSNLAMVIDRLQSNNVKLGFRIDRHGYHVTADRIDHIKSFRRPENLAEVRSFLGLMNFVDKFIVSRADKTQLMQEMLREKKFEWNAQVDSEFNFMRNEALLSIETLRFFDPSDTTELFVDASPVGLGAILVQRNTSGLPRIIACASKALSQTEKRYPQTVKRNVKLWRWSGECKDSGSTFWATISSSGLTGKPISICTAKIIDWASAPLPGPSHGRRPGCFHIDS